MMSSKSSETEKFREIISVILKDMHDKIEADSKNKSDDFTINHDFKAEVGELVILVCLCKDYKNADFVTVSTLETKISDLLNELKVINIFYV